MEIGGIPPRSVDNSMRCSQILSYCKHQCKYPINTANSYDSNGITFIPTLALGAKKQKLPKFCLHAFSWDPLSISEHIIYCSKDILRQSQRHWNHKKWCGIDGDIQEISLTIMNHGGE